MSIAPTARSSVLPYHGLAPFEEGKDAVVEPPVDHFFRSVWTYDGADAADLTLLEDSMRRVPTIESKLENADPPAATLPFELTQTLFGSTSVRASRLSTRFMLFEDFFTEPETTQRSSPGQLAYPNYEEQYFFGVAAPVPHVVTPEDWVALTPDILMLPIGHAYHLNGNVRTPVWEDNVPDWAVGWIVGGPDPLVPGVLPWEQVPADSGLAALATTDGSDGNPPQLLAKGRTIAQQLDYIQKNPGGVYMLVPFWAEDASVAVDLITASIAHSTPMVNG
jgi:hypothetical protein